MINVPFFLHLSVKIEISQIKKVSKINVLL